MNTVEQEFEKRCVTASTPDMIPHLRQLKALASGLDHVVEFGIRYGDSSLAFLAAGVRLTSYDIEALDKWDFPQNNWTRIVADTANLSEFPACDLLLIDTLHTQSQVEAELKWAKDVRKFICFHDVKVNGYVDEGKSGPGILPAIFNWLANNPVWRIKEYWPSDWGMLVCERTS